MIAFALISFLAGILTVLAPCILPLLPVIVGGSVTNSRKSKPYIIAVSLAVSVILFTLILKASTVFIDIPQTFWNVISGIIIIVFGFSWVMPVWWEKASAKINLLISRKSNKLLYEGVKKESIKGDIIIGASLGPIFSSCSPTYFVILATVLPRSFAEGFLNLTLYAIGLAGALLIVALLGQKIISKLNFATNPEGVFRKSIGILFLIVGVSIILGFDKKFQTYLITKGIYDPTKLEEKLTRLTDDEEMKEQISSGAIYPKFKEIVNPAGFVNSSPITIGEFTDKKVVLLDIMTYSCINCQRTFPYLNLWYERYKDKGLQVIAIHTPEFAFEHDPKNVEKAMKKFGIKFPVVLDNEYDTWNAYENRYWPRKYLIDIDGNIRYDHIGEGAYEETEDMIKKLLGERAEKLGEKFIADIKNGVPIPEKNMAGSPETYFGAFRNERLGNGKPFTTGAQNFVFNSETSAGMKKDFYYLNGVWNISEQFIEPEGVGELYFQFKASKVYLVAVGAGEIEVSIEGNLKKKIEVNGAELYTLFENREAIDGFLKLTIPEGVRIYAFTFG